MSPSSLSDYKAHYQLDAEAIIELDDLHPTRRVSERRRFEALLRLLQVRPDQRLLDIGCGSGWFSALCQEQGARVWALDMAPAGVARARARFPAVPYFQAGDVYHLPFADASFDAVVLSEVVEHLEHIEQALAQVRRVLKPGGRVLVSVPYRETILEHLCIHCNQLTPSHAHLHSFDESALREHLQEQGLAPAGHVLVTNKLLELAGFPRWSLRWPHWAWRGVDRLFNRLVRRPAFIGIVGVRTP
ncbi:MAG: methyltransferase domain-containing protein [Candidatus Latescibacteria bacterium]|nr:methyltransferase domain-containing protein [Candidatus Latescibacterota bacterium]